MVKECPIHGHFEDVMAIDTAFFKHLEEVFPGRDIRAHNDENLHKHGSSTITHGRGSVLTIDLTNRCNMMCDPCFMDANQVGFVHELSWEDIKTLLDNAITIKPQAPDVGAVLRRRADAVARTSWTPCAMRAKVGYTSVQAATNGIEFAKSPEFCRKAAEAGLRYAYLQFDGIGNAANSHRKVGNLFDVKLRAIENLYSNGVDIIPVITIINGINNEQVGRIIQFALDNPKKIPFLSFQPVSFTGRDEAVTDERRAAQRYTLSHLAHDVKNQTGLGEPARDWFPISFMSTFSDWSRPGSRAAGRLGPVELRLPPQLRRRHGRDGGQGNQGSRSGHGVPECRPTGQRRGPRQRRRPRQVALDHRHGAGGGAQLRSVPVAHPLQADGPAEEVRQDLRRDRQELRQGRRRPHDGRHRESAARDRWNFLFIAGMWFQDLFNYDLDRDEPVAAGVRIEHRAQDVGGGDDVGEHHLPVRVLDREDLARRIGELLVVAVTGADGLVEDGRVRRDAPDAVVVDELRQPAPGEQRPDRLSYHGLCP